MSREGQHLLVCAPFDQLLHLPTVGIIKLPLNKTHLLPDPFNLTAATGMHLLLSATVRIHSRHSGGQPIPASDAAALNSRKSGRR